MKVEIDISDEEATEIRGQWSGLFGGRLEDVLVKLAAALPRPIQVGDKVTSSSGWTYEVRFIEDGHAFLRCIADNYNAPGTPLKYNAYSLDALTAAAALEKGTP